MTDIRGRLADALRAHLFCDHTHWDSEHPEEGCDHLAGVLVSELKLKTEYAQDSEPGSLRYHRYVTDWVPEQPATVDR